MTTDYTHMMTQFEIPSNPFPGLRPFEFNESLLYFGRDGQSEQLLRKLALSRFMAVVGTSGSGKSSLVRAGLLPALFGGFMPSAGSNWRVCMMRPGNDPLGNLARAINDSGMFDSAGSDDEKLQTTMIEATLRRSSLGLVEAVRQARLGSDENVLVVADQFEELFRFAAVSESERYQNEAAAFVKLLLEAARQKQIPVYVAITMRSDFLGDCSLFWDLPEAINEGQYLIPRLTREQRREAITGPVAVCGADMTARLVNRLLNDVGDNPDQLPILQHALMRTWNNWKAENKESDPVDLRHYEAIGGMSAALSLHADEAHNELEDERSRKIAEKIFKALTEKGADNREIRRPVELGRLAALTEASEAEVIKVIEVFRREGRSFLMPPAGVRLDGDSLIDISHESLIRNWERLKTWVEEEARSARIYRRLAETAVLYQRGEAGLWRDPDLQLALDWRDESKPNETWARRYHSEFKTAMDFLDESREARDREAREREAQRKKEIRRTRLTAMIFALAFLLSLAALIFANIKKKNADTAAEKSRQLLYAANINLAQDAYYEENIQRAQELLADASTKQEDLRGFEWNYLNWLYHREEGELDGGDGIIRDLAYSPDNKYLATAGEHFVKLWDASSRRELLAIPIGGAIVNVLAFSPDGKFLAYGGEDSLVKLQKIGSAEAPAVLRGDGNPVTSIVFSRDSKSLVAGSGNRRGSGGVKIWDVDLLKVRFEIPGVEGSVSAVALSPDQRTIAIGRRNTSMILFDIDSGAAKTVAEAVSAMSAAFSPDGKTMIASVNWGGGLKVFEVKTGKKLATLEEFPIIGSNYARNAIVFSPDGKILAVGNFSTLRLYDAANLGQSPPRLITPLLGQKENIFALAFSPDGKTLAANDDRFVRFWDATAPRDSIAIAKKKIAIRDIFFSPDSQTVSIFSNTNSAFNSWDIASRQEIDIPANLAKEPKNMAYSPDGKFIATIVGSPPDTINLWDASSRELLASLSENLIRSETAAESIQSVAVSPDGKTLAAINIIAKTAETQDCVLKLWNTDSPREPVILKSETSRVEPSIEFSPDGRTLACLGKFEDGPSVQLWDVASGKEVSLRGSGIKSGGRIFFSPDGSRAVLTDVSDTVAELWDLRSQKLIATLANRQRYAKGLFSPDGKIFAVVNWSNDRSLVTLWDSQTGEFLTKLEGYTRRIFCMAFSPDGKTLATGTDDGLVKLWSVASHRLLVTLYEENKRAFVSIAFSPDNRMLITGSTDGSVRLWPAPPEQAQGNER
jgi:WD40 repeat protein